MLCHATSSTATVIVPATSATKTVAVTEVVAMARVSEATVCMRAPQFLFTVLYCGIGCIGSEDEDEDEEERGEEGSEDGSDNVVVVVAGGKGR
jgi:hypothetical protein